MFYSLFPQPFYILLYLAFYAHSLALKQTSCPLNAVVQNTLCKPTTSTVNTANPPHLLSTTRPKTPFDEVFPARPVPRAPGGSPAARPARPRARPRSAPPRRAAGIAADSPASCAPRTSKDPSDGRTLGPVDEAAAVAVAFKTDLPVPCGTHLAGHPAALADSCAGGAMSVSEIFVELQGFLAAEQDIREVSPFSPAPFPCLAGPHGSSALLRGSVSSGGEVSGDGSFPSRVSLGRDPPRFRFCSPLVIPGVRISAPRHHLPHLNVSFPLQHWFMSKAQFDLGTRTTRVLCISLLSVS